MEESKNEGRDLWTAESIMATLVEAQGDGSLERATKYHTVDLDEVRQKLENLNYNFERVDLLKYAFPCLYLLIL